MFEHFHQHRQTAIWIITIFTICVFIFLGVRYIEGILAALLWFFGLFKSLLIGIIGALILNVPMGAIQQYLFPKHPFHKARRPLAIALTLLFVFGLFAGIALLVIPELLDAFTLLSQVIFTGLDALETAPWQDMLDIDWSGIRAQLQQWTDINQIMALLRSLTGELFDLFIGLIFAIYILGQKERLKSQATRLIKVWLPRKFSKTLLYITDISCQTFRRFITGQALEGVILGTLCMAGMGILNIPYAPTIGVLVGVTALLPIVGALIGIVVGGMIIFTVNPVKALVFVIFLLVLQQLENNLIYPKVVGSKIHLPAIWVLAAVTVGGNLAGPLGMFLGVPAASTAYALLREITAKKEMVQG